ncbi:hypothetical protein [Streptosporangium sp. H16]
MISSSRSASVSLLGGAGRGTLSRSVGSARARQEEPRATPANAQER